MSLKQESSSNGRLKATLERLHRIVHEGMIRTDPAGAGSFRVRLCFRLATRLQRRCTRGHVPGATLLRTVRPIAATRAVLWLLGRPWEGSSRCPNLFPYPMPPGSTTVPLAIALEAKTQPQFASPARRLLWLAGAQLDILCLETLWCLAGRRGKGRASPTNRPCSAARTFPRWAFSCRARPTTPPASAPLPESIS